MSWSIIIKNIALKKEKHTKWSVLLKRIADKKTKPDGEDILYQNSGYLFLKY
jgi:hypothetical protein